MTKPLGDIPRGIEVLVKKAAVDGAFREALLRERARAADRIGLVLEPAEAAMLAAIPAKHWEQVVAGTRGPAPLRAAFMGYAAAAMLAAVTPAVAGTDDKPEPNLKKYGWDDYGVINGVLPHDIFGEDLSGITVKLRGSNVTYVTDSTGNFELKPIYPRTYGVQFIRNNIVIFDFDWDSIDVEAGCTSTIEFKPRGSEAIADLIINPIEDPTVFYGPDAMVTPDADYGKVRGVVTNTIGKPIADALVVVRGTSRYCTTAADGTFAITSIPEGTYEVKVSRVGYGEVTKKSVRVCDNSYTNVSFTLAESLCGGIRPDDIRNRERPSALNTLMNKIFGK